MSLRPWLAALLTLLAAGPVRAEPSAVFAAFDGIYKTDLASPGANFVGNFVGETGFSAGLLIAIEGMTYSPDRVLYGVSDNLKVFVRIDQTSGLATIIGPLALGGEGQFNNLDPALAATSDGRFWLTSATLGKLWRLDPASGSTTLVGDLGVTITGLAARGNSLFGAGSRGDEGLYRIDTDTGHATLIARFNDVIPYAASISLAFDDQDRLWAAVNYNPPPNDSGPIATWSDLALIDVSTGAIALQGVLTGPDELQTIPIRGLAITAPHVVGGAPVDTIPAVSTWSLLMLVGLILFGTSRRLSHRSAR